MLNVGPVSQTMPTAGGSTAETGVTVLPATVAIAGTPRMARTASPRRPRLSAIRCIVIPLVIRAGQVFGDDLGGQGVGRVHPDLGGLAAEAAGARLFERLYARS